MRRDLTRCSNLVLIIHIVNAESIELYRAAPVDMVGGSVKLDRVYDTNISVRLLPIVADVESPGEHEGE